MGYTSSKFGLRDNYLGIDFLFDAGLFIPIELDQITLAFFTFALALYAEQAPASPRG